MKRKGTRWTTRERSICVTFDRTHRHEAKTLGIHFISDTRQLVKRK